MFKIFENWAKPQDEPLKVLSVKPRFEQLTPCSVNEHFCAKLKQIPYPIGNGNEYTKEQNPSKEAFIRDKYAQCGNDKSEAAKLITFLGTAKKKNEFGTVCCAIAFNNTDIIITINHDNVDYCEKKSRSVTQFYKTLIDIDNFKSDQSDEFLSRILRSAVSQEKVGPRSIASVTKISTQNSGEKDWLLKLKPHIKCMPELPEDKVPDYFRDIMRIHRYFKDHVDIKPANGSYVKVNGRFRFLGLYLEVIRAQFARDCIDEVNFKEQAIILLPVLPTFFLRGILGYLSLSCVLKPELIGNINVLLEAQDKLLEKFFKNENKYPYSHTIDCFNSILWLLRVKRQKAQLQLVESPNNPIIHCEIQLLFTLSQLHPKKDFTIIVSKPFCGSCTVFFYGFIEYINKGLKQAAAQQQVGVTVDTSAAPPVPDPISFEQIVAAVGTNILNEFMSFPWCRDTFPGHSFSIYNGKVYLSKCAVLFSILLIMFHQNLLLLLFPLMSFIVQLSADCSKAVILN